MIFWIAIAAMTAVVALVLILPLARASAGAGRDAAAEDRAKEQAVYRDQLRELDRDKAEGLIGAAEADYARAEIGRRLIAVSQPVDAGGDAPAQARRPLRVKLAEIAVILLLPALGVPLYLLLGAPGVPGQPIEEKLANPGNDLNLLLAKVERHLLQEPDDGKGWDLVAPIYYRNGLYDKAINAYRNAIRTEGKSPERSGNLAESLIALGQGRVNDEAIAALNDVLSADPKNPRARFYLALRLEQDGKRAEAFAAYRAIRADAAPDANYLQLVDQHIAATDPAKPAPPVEAAAPGNPGAEDVAAAETMSPGDRQQMILGMVATLDARLKNEPKNFEGWMRLIRSYGVLGDRTKAAEALKSALANFPADTPEGRQLGELGAGMGLSPEGGAE
jgi:cytochrome c-type biogenesis protein CcmH